MQQIIFPKYFALFLSHSFLSSYLFIYPLSVTFRLTAQTRQQNRSRDAGQGRQNGRRLFRPVFGAVRPRYRHGHPHLTVLGEFDERGRGDVGRGDPGPDKAATPQGAVARISRGTHYSCFFYFSFPVAPFQI